MSNRYHHPEGVHRGFNFLDWRDWPLKRYVKCLRDEDELNESLKVAHLMASADSGSDTFTEKWTLRYHGLQILRDVDNEQDTE